MSFLLSVLSLIGLGILVILILILKKLTDLSFPQIVVRNEQPIDIEDSVHGGMKRAIKELEHEKEEQELLMKRLDKRAAMGVFNTANAEEPIDTHGYLIPANLTEDEKELLRMFYNQ